MGTDEWVILIIVFPTLRIGSIRFGPEWTVSSSGRIDCISYPGGYMDGFLEKTLWSGNRVGMYDTCTPTYIILL
jgi:hypothetical protein